MHNKINIYIFARTEKKLRNDVHSCYLIICPVFYVLFILMATDLITKRTEISGSERVSLLTSHHCIYRFYFDKHAILNPNPVAKSMWPNLFSLWAFQWACMRVANKHHLIHLENAGSWIWMNKNVFKIYCLEHCNMNTQVSNTNNKNIVIVYSAGGRNGHLKKYDIQPVYFSSKYGSVRK